MKYYLSYMLLLGILFFLVIPASAQREYVAFDEQGNKAMEVIEYYRDYHFVIQFHTNGKMKASGYVQDGKYHGKWTCWDESGEKSMIAYFDQGVKDGKWVVFDKERNKYYHIYYRNDHIRIAHEFDMEGEFLAFR